MTYVQHRVELTVGPVNTDVEVELTFFEMRSLAERRHMDADDDGTIMPAETREYLADRATTFDDSLELRVDGRRLDLIPLYEPQIDLLGVDRIAPAHHVVRLFYFARTPAWLKPGTELVLDDRLWSSAPTIRTAQAVGTGGVTVQTLPEAPAATASRPAASSRRTRVRCVSAPVSAIRVAQGFSPGEPESTRPFATPTAEAAGHPFAWSAPLLAGFLSAVAWSFFLRIRRNPRDGGPNA